MRVTRGRERRNLVIDQKHYVEGIVDKLGTKGCNYIAPPGYGTEIPLEQSHSNVLDDDQKKGYQAITGSVMYLTQVSRYIA